MAKKKTSKARKAAYEDEDESEVVLDEAEVEVDDEVPQPEISPSVSFEIEVEPAPKPAVKVCTKCGLPNSEMRNTWYKLKHSIQKKTSGTTCPRCGAEVEHY